MNTCIRRRKREEGSEGRREGGRRGKEGRGIIQREIESKEHTTTYMYILSTCTSGSEGRREGGRRGKEGEGGERDNTERNRE